MSRRRSLRLFAKWCTWPGHETGERGSSRARRRPVYDSGKVRSGQPLAPQPLRRSAMTYTFHQLQEKTVAELREIASEPAARGGAGLFADEQGTPAAGSMSGVGRRHPRASLGHRHRQGRHQSKNPRVETATRCSTSGGRTCAAQRCPAAHPPPESSAAVTYAIGSGQRLRPERGAKSPSESERGCGPRER